MPFYSFPFGTSIAFDFCMRVIFLFVNFSKLVSNLWCKWTKRTRIRNKRKKTKTSEPLKFRKKNIHLLESWFKREKKSLRKSNLNAWMTDIIEEIAVFFSVCMCEEDCDCQTKNSAFRWWCWTAQFSKVFSLFDSKSHLIRYTFTHKCVYTISNVNAKSASTFSFRFFFLQFEYPFLNSFFSLFFFTYIHLRLPFFVLISVIIFGNSLYEWGIFQCEYIL